MTYGELLYDIPNSLRELIRSLEKESRKLIKAEWSAKYYTSCLNENMLPKHTYISDSKLCEKLIMILYNLESVSILIQLMLECN